jgi:hypothetical protein
LNTDGKALVTSFVLSRQQRPRQAKSKGIAVDVRRLSEAFHLLFGQFSTKAGRRKLAAVWSKIGVKSVLGRECGVVSVYLYACI